MGITLHWLDEKTLERKAVGLACRRMTGTHSYDRIAQLMLDVHDEFTINDRTVGVTTDNASNFCKAFR